MDKTFFNVLVIIINNAFILFSLIFFYIASNYDIKTKIKKYQVITGILIGVASVIMMNQPFSIADGILVDSRSVLFAVVGTFFGFLPTIIGASIAIVFRLYVGGGGVFVGVLIIIMNAMFGILWSMVSDKPRLKNKYLETYIYAFFTQVLTVLLILTVPSTNMKYAPLLVIYLGFYPIAILLTSLVISYQKIRMEKIKRSNLQKTLLKQAIDSIDNLEVFAVDKYYNYLSFNKHHEMMMKKFNFITIDTKTNFVDSIINYNLKTLLEENIKKALKGKDYKEVKNMGDHYYEYHFNPIYSQDEIIGVTILANDITAAKNHEKDLLNNSYMDALTNIYNRRYFSVIVSDIEFYNLVTVITCDVNGLKVINDTFGHHMGDKYLVNFAKILKEKFESYGYVFRMGGDEFSIILPNIDKEDATFMIEEVIQVVEKENTSILTISFSYGIETKYIGDSLSEVIRISEEQMYKRKLFEVTSHRSKFIETILQSLYEKSPGVERHSKRVSLICNEIGKKLNMSNFELNLLQLIAKLHDIGKIAIDEAILNKKGKLTDQEWETIKKHPEIGYRLISTSPEYKEIAYDILSHHERYDGKGYPQGLSGEAIPIRARIITLADSFDAMISERSYKPKMSLEEAISEIIRCKGGQFDPILVDIFLDLVQNGALQNIDID